MSASFAGKWIVFMFGGISKLCVPTGFVLFFCFYGISTIVGYLMPNPVYRYIWFFFIIQRVKARAIPCPHQLQTSGDNTVSVAQGGTATPGATKQLLPPDRVFRELCIYIYNSLYTLNIYKSTKLNSCKYCCVSLTIQLNISHLFSHS